MRRILLSGVCLLLIRFVTIAQMDCRFTEYTQQTINRYPNFALALKRIETFTHEHLQQSGNQSGPGGITTGQSGPLSSDGLPVITIPVVVHILYNSSAQNISDEQVLSQIDVLNKDYRKLNADTAKIPSYYLPLAADCGFHFALAKVDTAGYATSGIVRKHTDVLGFGISDGMKFSNSGGDDAWDRDHYLNIWVCNFSGGVVGYSSVPGGPKETDGVAISYTAFGTQGTARAPYNLGRTATHEIGHWLNMIHVWGDSYCGNDYVDDTPQQQAANRGDPTGIRITCGNGPYGDMYMDYMDLTDDTRMNMFTYGQRARMRTLFAPGGARESILHSTALTAVPIPVPGNAGDGSGSRSAGFSLRLYPNPVSASATIEMSDESQIGSVLEIYNQVGQQVMSARVGALQMTMDLSGLKGGVYFIRLSSNKQQSVARLVKI